MKARKGSFEHPAHAVLGFIEVNELIEVHCGLLRSVVHSAHLTSFASSSSLSRVGVFVLRTHEARKLSLGDDFLNFYLVYLGARNLPYIFAGVGREGRAP